MQTEFTVPLTISKNIMRSKGHKACQNSWLCAPIGGVWCIYKGVVRHTKKANAQTGTFGFCRHAKPTLKNQKSLFCGQRWTKGNDWKEIITTNKLL